MHTMWLLLSFWSVLFSSSHLHWRHPLAAALPSFNLAGTFRHTIINEHHHLHYLSVLSLLHISIPRLRISHRLPHVQPHSQLRKYLHLLPACGRTFNARLESSAELNVMLLQASRCIDQGLLLRTVAFRFHHSPLGADTRLLIYPLRAIARG